MFLNLVNTTIETKKFPESKNISKILPHRKNNDGITNPETLHPIHIISVLSKIIEKAICKQIIRFLISNNLISQSLQGGVPMRSSTTTVTEINEQAIEILSNKLVGALVVMDQSATFDVVSHSILKKKLEHRNKVHNRRLDNEQLDQ